MKRRDFIKLLGIGGSGILATPGVLAAVTAGSQVSVVPKLMFDGRYAPALDYANRLTEKGVSSYDTQGDLVGLWYRDSDAFRLRSGQVMLGYTTWSDYQALRILMDDARRGRERHLERQGSPGRLTLLRQNTSRNWPEGWAMHFPSPPNKENRVHLVTWLASG